MKRTFYNCPKCKCRFLAKSDLQYHLLTHIPQPKPPEKTETVLPLDLRRVKYAEKLRLFRLNYCQPGKPVNPPPRRPPLPGSWLLQQDSLLKKGKEERV